MLSGYITDSEGMKPWVELYQGDLQTCSDFDLMNEVADSRITPHIQKAICRDIVHSNDSVIVIYLLYYIHYFINLHIEDFWIKFGIRDKSRHIPVHKLGLGFGS